MATVSVKGLIVHWKSSGKDGKLSVGDLDLGFDGDVAKLVEESDEEQYDRRQRHPLTGGTCVFQPNRLVRTTFTRLIAL